ncbi:Stk1 family PASTA domain-containing Ser/Thr kinase [Vallicoccus soli]|uniref:non-specific serine/threonine protein kinase n=1 Tax=Vallicoccus soli TaxID=2339232 RepID=A0A3A3Z2E8_9ACTN|nr:Stk1 family PASTA domain-containing Ser/Thr kinase [Vallicoccus soli]RJK96859.1 Stk1 family PASTA domain-containing Ser/Thr kinase [Vallicoccus soli]
MDTALSDPLVGRVLDGRYRVVARIARGGMATVYEALDTRLDRPVAVKVMHPALAADEEAVARFIREARASARLSDPGVVAVFDQGTDGDEVFLVMEHVEGRTLRALLRERGRLGPGEALDLLERVLAALAAAHRAGIVHRDVKPENVLLADDGRVKVADFGLARAATSSHTGGALVGTVSYLAPELVERGVADARSDVYSAGVVLFELLTGGKPFTGDSAVQVAYRHVHDDVPPPSSRVPGLDPALDRIVARATSRDPDGRPADAGAMLDEVVAAHRRLGAEALEHDPGAPEPTLVVDADGHEPTTAVPRHGTPRRRRRSPLVALLLVLALLGGGTAWWYAAGPGARTDVPALLGLTAEQAADRAREAGLEVRTLDPAYSETVPAGQVLRTEPGPGGSVADGGTVGVVLSRGPERIAVPDVVGAPRDDAEAAVDGAGLQPVVEGRWDDDVPAGEVVSVSPGEGQELRRGTAVTLVVSRGPAPVELEDWSGRPADEATEALEGAGLVVEREEAYDEQVARGDVLVQDPAASTVRRGDTVTLLVSLGPPLVDVPRVVDRKVDDAREALEGAGFAVRTRGTEILGRVLTQSPGGGQAPKGSTVTLTTI